MFPVFRTAIIAAPEEEYTSPRCSRSVSRCSVLAAQKYCPACKCSVSVPDDKDLFACSHCGKELSIHHKYVTIVVLLAYACGILFAIPEYERTPVFIFAALSCAFLCVLLVFSFIFPLLPLELTMRRARNRPRRSWTKVITSGHLPI